MFDLSALPSITFVGTGSRKELNLARCGAAIERISQRVISITSPGETVGLVFSTGPSLVLAWLGVLAAGRVPLMLQYPNEKISKSYWRELLQDTVFRCAIRTLFCAPALSEYELEELVACEFLEEPNDPEGDSKPLSFPASGHVLQLSSGTTGFKKPVRLEFDALKKHAELYNQVVRLTSEDRVVSWLPLYHDMGYIACFVMPLLLGIPVVMIDPMTWVRHPRLLYDAIQEYKGSICYMPNFGFEVMAKLGKAGPFPSMRHWISCSEPTYAATLNRFMQASGADASTVSACYAMAENVFAVTQSAGMRIIEHDGQTYVSCGGPVPQTEVKVVDGELFVRSPYSLSAYEGGQKISDADGFYPTGDLGFIHEGEIVVAGRKQDLANIGGRKYQLNDWDVALATLFPQSAGRIASLAMFDEQSGTEKALFLIEAHNFWEWERSPEPTRLIRELTGVEWMEVHFVPPQFITKTSSGKINRKRTLQDWLAFRSSSTLQLTQRSGEELERKLAENFPRLIADRPAQEQLDSLGQLVLRIICEDHGIPWTPELTPQQILATGTSRKERAQTEVFSIVALMDGNRLGFGAPKPHISDSFLEAIAEIVGCPVHFEHVAVPPSPILFSDLIFHDYFMPRNPQAAYGPLSAVFTKIKNASLILIDDEDNFRLPSFCAYPVLDHQFTMQPEAELLGHRMQRYTENHHLLPRRVVLGSNILPQSINITLKNFESYLQIPVYKMAFHAEFRAFTGDWNFCAHRVTVIDTEKRSDFEWVERFQHELIQFILENRERCRTRQGEPVNRFIMVDPPHFCSFLMNRMAVDFVTRIYDSFCIIGRPSSMPYLQRRLESLGKPYFYSLAVNSGEYECLLLTGGLGGKKPETDKPFFDFVHARDDADGGGRPENVPPEIAHACPPFVECDEALYRSLLKTHGVLTGNLLLNHVARQQAQAQQQQQATPQRVPA